MLPEDIAELEALKAKVEALPRYSCGEMWGMEQDTDGAWIRIEDVVNLLHPLKIVEYADYADNERLHE